VLLVLLVSVVGLTGFVFFATHGSARPSGSTTRSTYYQTDAASIVGSAIQGHTSGYTLEASKTPGTGGSGTQTEDWVELTDASGSVANMSATVFGSVNASQKYYTDFVANQKALPGYVDISSDLSSFRDYGGCYANGEDVDGIAVINGVCSKGNVVLWIHLASGVDFSQLESDLTNLMGAMYTALG
jgi:hypothetical protein